ncbi:MAG: hypothetical protein AVDCRST_MAG14-975, partial [uncultured Rubrobacteraceae bacterium]
ALRGHRPHLPCASREACPHHRRGRPRAAPLVARKFERDGDTGVARDASRVYGRRDRPPHPEPLRRAHEYARRVPQRLAHRRMGPRPERAEPQGAAGYRGSQADGRRL